MEEQAVTLVTSQIELFGAFGLALVITLAIAVVFYRLFIQERRNCKEIAANLVSSQLQFLEVNAEHTTAIALLTQNLSAEKESNERLIMTINDLKSKVDQCRVA